MIVLLVALGAAIGAPLRYLVDQALPSPWGTFAVNVVGSFLLGCLVSISTEAGYAMLGTGFCGALTTYSTFGYETVRLARAGSPAYALLNAVGSIAVGLLAAWAGLALFS